MDILRLTVLGAGVMGHGIAQKAAMSGIKTTLFDIDQTMLDKAQGVISKNIEKHFVGKGKITAEEGEEILGRLTTSTDLVAAAKEADMVIEAVPENLELKKSLFSKLDEICPEHAILATNTSVLPVTAIAGATKRPEKCIGTHFFNPAAVMKLVEVVLPVGVAEETVETVMNFCKQLGKVPVRVKDVPGFIVNRLLCPLYMEAAQIVLEGTATAEEVDTAMKLGAGHPMGPCELADFGGFDVIQMAQDSIYEYTHRESDRLNILYRKMLEAGRLGRKNGKGFYDYEADGTKKLFKLFQ
ncbi:3-hydroxyacyl-CoA dehydrogenase family protein [Desulfatibacillum aliphaticivorans]|uniref:3-hydroxyacyl-CoA dehydrogenase family protein n=1 Tax=Desulfatibacillum aliphaticivorans TaxID=218208 RepID=UPI0003F8E13C|nr:3-hydroxyacyl-CoA dehydrogenase family protein [Desulfatibacillum aliphaticivorans]